MGLTKRLCDAESYADKGNARHVLWDDNPIGLGLRVFPSGKKAFVLSYRINGRKRFMSLGTYGVMTLDEARRLAKAELVALDSSNRDPLSERRRRAQEARTGTIELMYRAYVAAKSPAWAESAGKVALQVGELHIFPTLGAKVWRDTRRSEIQAWHTAIPKAYAANRALQALRAAFYWRLLQEDDTQNEIAARSGKDARNPCTGIPLKPEKPRQVRLELHELPRLEAAIDGETTDPYLRTVFRFLLSTGCRTGEALALRWSDVSLATKSQQVTFRDTKNGSDRVTPLTPYAAKLLRALPKIEGNEFVFVGRFSRGRLNNLQKAWRRIRVSAGLPHLRIHDLRRSFGSWLGDEGFSSKQIGDVLGHRTDVTSRVYMALGAKSSRNAVNSAQRLMAQARSPRRKRGVRHAA